MTEQIKDKIIPVSACFEIKYFIAENGAIKYYITENGAVNLFEYYDSYEQAETEIERRKNDRTRSN